VGNIAWHRRHLRRLTRNSGGTISVSIPVEQASTLGWRKGQLVKITRSGRKLIISDAGAAEVRRLR